MPIKSFILITTLFLAYVNGANDNFKGTATLFGSGSADFKKSLWWATVTTFLGSLAAIYVSSKLILPFTGKGMLPDDLVNTPYFLLSVGIGSSLTVFIATLTGIPISTTHSLIGALVGAGLFSVGALVNFSVLGNQFFWPLLLSPAMSLILTVIIYPCFKLVKQKLGIKNQMCLCIGKKVEPVSINQDGTAVLNSSGISLTVSQLQNCQQYYQGKVFGFDFHSLVDQLHYLSAGAMCFARGLNDTPKIVAPLLVMNAFSLSWGTVYVAVAMAVGGIFSAKKVATTMSKRITKMNRGQGFTANLVTAFLVIFASKWGMPVSTTHVSCGSIFGIGLANKKANFSVITDIVLAWVLTIPLAALLSAFCCFILKQTL